ncbi:MAG: T9SS type A sorting domain-containing protein [Chitinophagaceae bacterium]|nr:T9SS type A sorting domain-containing protein [Chitinophagaceae bacterium]
MQDRLNCGYFSNIYIPNGGPLPVKYLSFDAVVNDKTVVLNWITAEELNHNYYEVERSFDMNDYNTLGMVLDGFIMNGTGKKYQFKDNSPELTGRSIAYYRLKQFDIDGKVTYSKVLAVRLQAKADVVMQVSPNPFTENLNVRFTSGESGTAQIRIVNSTGQTMLSKQALISKGYNNIQVEGLSGLATGMYVAQLIMNGTIIDNQRVIKNAF